MKKSTFKIIIMAGIIASQSSYINTAQLSSAVVPTSTINQTPKSLVELAAKALIQQIRITRNSLPSVDNITDSKQEQPLLHIPLSLFTFFANKLCAHNNYLSLRNKKLNSLDGIMQIPQIKTVTHLDLSFNQLTIIPEVVGNFTQLRNLSLAGNKLTIFPDFLGKLTRLRHLDLYENELTIIPEAIGSLAQLQSLSLAGNQLTIIPEAIGNLIGLDRLDLSRNQLTTLPKSIDKLTELERLSLSGNPLENFPDFLGSHAQLRHLDLAQDQLSIIPEAISRNLRFTISDSCRE